MTGKQIWLTCILFQFILAGQMVFGQSPVPDRFYAHLDKPFYVSGEIIHFKVYVLSPYETPSILIHADLIDEHGNTIGEQLMNLENNACDGSLRIPLTQPEGLYYFRIYSLWNLNFISSFNFIKPITIYNDFNQSDEGLLEDSLTINHEDFGHLEEGKLEISVLNKDPIHTRETILLKVRNPQPSQGNILSTASVSVMDLDKCGADHKTSMESYYEKQKQQSTSIKSLDFQPEESILIEGQISEIGSGDPVNSKVLSIFDTHNSSFSRIESFNGKFSFKLPVFMGSTHLQLINMNPFQSKVNRVERHDLSAFIPVPEASGIELQKNQYVRKYLYYSRLRKKINEIYSESSPDSIRLMAPSFLPFKPDRSYRMDKYQLLTNLEDFMREGVVNTSHIMEDGIRKILLYNQETKKYFMKSPWFVVDGHFIFDDSITHTIPFNELKQVDIFNTNESILKYFDPIMIQGGVVAVYTKNNLLIDYINSQPNTLTVMGLSSHLETHSYQIRSSSTMLDHTPDLNPLIYWNSNIAFNEEGIIELGIPANDVSGKYLIHIEGMDAAGQPLTGRKVIEVFP